MFWSPPSDVGSGPITEYQVTLDPGGCRVTSADCSGTPVVCAAVVGELDTVTAYTVTIAAVNAAGVSRSSTPAGPVAARLTVKQTPKVMGSDALQSLQEIRTDRLLIFKDPPQAVARLVKGDLIIFGVSAKTGRGFMGRVVATSDEGGGFFTVATTRSSIGDVFSDAAVATNLAITAGDLEVSREFVSEQNGMLGKIEAQAEIGLDPDFQVDAKSTAFTGTLNFLTKEEVRVKGGATLSWDKEIELGSVHASCITIPAGEVPVVICPEFTAKLGVETVGSAGVSLAVSHEYKAVIRCQVGSSAPDDCQATTETDHEVPTPVAAYGDASLNVSLPVDLSFLVYGVIGPAITGSPYVELKADTTQDPWWELRLGIKAGVAVNLSAFFPGDNTLYKKDDILKTFVTVLHADGPFFGLEITPQHTNLSSGGSVQLQAQAPRFPDALLTVQRHLSADPPAGCHTLRLSDGRTTWTARYQRTALSHPPSEQAVAYRLVDESGSNPTTWVALARHGAYLIEVRLVVLPLSDDLANQQVVLEDAIRQAHALAVKTL